MRHVRAPAGSPRQVRPPPSRAARAAFWHDALHDHGFVAAAVVPAPKEGHHADTLPADWHSSPLDDECDPGRSRLGTEYGAHVAARAVAIGGRDYQGNPQR